MSDLPGEPPEAGEPGEKQSLPSIQGSSGTVLPLVFFCVFFLVSGSLGYLAIQTIARYQDDVTNALENVYLIDELYIEVLKAETGQRGYLLTQLESYLPQYNEAVSVMGFKLAALAEADLDEVQRQRLPELQQLVEEKQEEMATTIKDIQSNRSREAIAMIFTHRGRDLMEEITDLVLIMESHERNVLNQRVLQTRDSRSTALLMVVLANLVGLIMVFIAWTLIRNSQRKELLFVDELEQANTNLEAKVEERTRELERYSTELRRSNRELQDFAFVASHDLQEPLRKIRAFGDRLQGQYAESLGEKGSDYVRRMQNASERMSRLIEDLLAFSRITTRVKAFEPVDLNRVLEEVIEDLEVAIQDSHARLESDALPMIDGDYSQMKQLLQNLIGNALKFTREGTNPHIEVRVASLTNDNSVITVTDNGIGFDSKFADRIFMPFQRLHGKNQYTGTGIGLAICRRITERHGGTLTASAEPGKGSTFVITLPLTHNPLEEVEVNNSKGDPHSD